MLVLVLLASCEEDPPAPACDGSLSVTVTSTKDAACGSTDGSINVSATGGDGNYEFKLNQGSFQGSGQFASLAPGTYTVTVKDGNDCTAEESVKILSGLKLADIEPIITTNCAISNCHDGSAQGRPNFSMSNQIVSNAGRIKARTSAKTMPPANASTSLSDAEIALIACWADDGAPQ